MGRRSRATKADLRVGKSIWVPGYGKCRITSNIVKPHGVRFLTVLVGDYHQPVYLGDRGVPGYKYDDRPNQLTTNKRACKVAEDDQEAWLNRHLRPTFKFDYGIKPAKVCVPMNA